MQNIANFTHNSNFTHIANSNSHIYVFIYCYYYFVYVCVCGVSTESKELRNVYPEWIWGEMHAPMH